jgi:hypothetical protein
MLFDNWVTPDELRGIWENFDIIRIFLMTIDNTGKFPLTEIKLYAIFGMLNELWLIVTVELIQRSTYEEQMYTNAQ